MGLENLSGPVIVVCGGAGGLENGLLGDAGAVLGPAVSNAAAACGATVVDGGTESGVMRIVGDARGQNPRAMPILVGVAPRGKVREPSEPESQHRTPLEPHHSHFVLADSSEWGGETALLFQIAATLATPDQVVVLLAGGGDNARREALEAVRRGWPIVVAKGFGGLADDLASAVGRRAKAIRRQRDYGLRRLAAYHHIRVFSGDATTLSNWLTWELTDRPVLRYAWRMFAACDARAKKLQTSFKRFQRLIIGLGIAVTGLALLDADRPAVHWTTVIVPTVIALLIAWSRRRAIGKQWILLRAVAEAVKTDTFRYRTGTAPYGARLDREHLLEARLEVIRPQLLSIEVARGRLSRPTGPGPPDGLDEDSLDDLDPERYVQRRITDQLAYYDRRVREKTWRRDCLLLLTLAGGGVGTVLAALGLEPVVALTTAVSAGAASYLTSLQHEHDIVVYNQSAWELDATQLAWAASGRSPTAEAVEWLVGRTETILTEEVGGWARRMTRALDEAQRQREGSEHVAGRAATMDAR